MKKFVFFMTIVAMSFILCACDPSIYTIDREQLNDVVNVELIEYDNPNQKHFAFWVTDQFDRLVPFQIANATVLETLSADKTADFLESFSQTDIFHTYYAYDSPKDICLRLNYENGNFLIVWANYAENRFEGYIGEYSSDGTVLTFWGSFSALSYYEDLVNNYFTYSLE